MKMIILATLTTLIFPMALVAGDGVLEIHQACVATGCFEGDSAGWPVTIASPGSYRLTSSLSLPDQNTTGIDVTADQVTLDLGGFSITGVTECDANFEHPFVVTCSPLGSGVGIRATSGDGSIRRSTKIHNGFIRGTGSTGIDVRDGEIRGVEVTHAGKDGIHGERSVAVSSSRVELVRSYGIIADDGAIEGCYVRAAGSYGIHVIMGRIVNSRVRWVTVSGIASNSEVVVTGSMVNSATGFALELSPRSGYGGNSLWNCNGGAGFPQVDGGHEISTNVCNLDTTCP